LPRPPKSAKPPRRKFNEESEKVQSDYAKQTAQASIAYLEAVLDSDKLTAEQREAYAKQLAEAKIKLSEATTDEEIANIEKNCRRGGRCQGEAVESFERLGATRSGSICFHY